MADGTTSNDERQTSAQRRVKYGVAVVLAAMAGLFFPTIATVLVILAGFLIAAGRDPNRIDDFLGSVPGGIYASKALAEIDRRLS